MTIDLRVGLMMALLPVVAYGDLQPLNEIAATARAYFVAQAVDRELDITVGRLDARLRLVRCPTTLLATQSPGARTQGHTSVNVRCDSAWSIFVPVTIREKHALAVAASALPTGHLLTNEDIRFEPTWILDASRDYLFQKRDAEGRRTTRPIAAGTPLTAGMLRTSRAVKRGAAVTVALARGPLAIRVAGVALQDGAIGDRIQVRNAGSKRVVEAEIRGDGTLVIR
ncbi:MAG: flagellar basal body P-ring formation chaperone FlgA [Gammaproteobacteria bacterium]